MNKKIIRRGMEYYIEVEPLDGEEYEYQMMMANRIPRLIPVSLEYVDQKKQILYETTGCKSFVDVWAKQWINETELKNIVESILDAIKNVNQYLLYPDNLVLQMDSMFVDTKNERVMFLYMPGYKKDILEQICELTEALTQKVERENVKAVMLAWKLHMMTKEPQISLKMLEDCLVEQENKVEVMQRLSLENRGLEKKEESRKKRNFMNSLLAGICILTIISVVLEGYTIFHIYYYGIALWKRNLLLGNTVVLAVLAGGCISIFKKVRVKDELKKLFSA